MSYNPNYKWINPTYPIYNWGYNPFTKWDEPPSSLYVAKQPTIHQLPTSGSQYELVPWCSMAHLIVYPIAIQRCDLAQFFRNQNQVWGLHMVALFKVYFFELHRCIRNI